MSYDILDAMGMGQDTQHARGLGHGFGHGLVLGRGQCKGMDMEHFGWVTSDLQILDSLKPAN